MMTDTEIRKARLKGIPGSILFVLVTALFLFIPAGTLNWPAAWALLAVHAGVFVVLLLTISPGLIEERSKQHTDSKGWDRRLVMILFLLGYVVFIVAGLDFRYAWTGPLPMIVPVTGFGVVVLGNLLVIRASTVNEFFSAITRIQTGRGHEVVSKGPYRIVRHPGYAGMITYVLFQPLLLGSLWALVPAVLVVGLFVLRTSLEDRTLQDELPGYREYAQEVRYRLVPGVW